LSEKDNLPGGEFLDGSMVTSMLLPDGICPSRLSCSGFSSLPAEKETLKSVKMKSFLGSFVHHLHDNLTKPGLKG